MAPPPARKRAKAKTERKGWTPPEPDVGGGKIPEPVRERVRQRLEAYAAEHYAGKYTRLDIRFRAQFCYIDAYQEPRPGSYRAYPGNTESEEEFYTRMRETPTHLCRLRYFGREDRWGMAFYTYSTEEYVFSPFDTGRFWGTPEEGLDTGAVGLR